MNDDKKWKIPARYRIDDLTDERQAELLSKANEKQLEWQKLVHAPFAQHTPKDRERANSLITIDSLENAKKHIGLTDEQREQLAEAYAVVGRYDLAKKTSKDQAKESLFQKLWDAVWLDDENWCEHDAKHKYIKENVYSLKEGKELPLLACNVCGKWNVLDSPDHLKGAQKKRATIRKSIRKSDSITDLLSQHNQLRNR